MVDIVKIQSRLYAPVLREVVRYHDRISDKATPGEHGALRRSWIDPGRQGLEPDCPSGAANCLCGVVSPVAPGRHPVSGVAQPFHRGRSSGTGSQTSERNFRSEPWSRVRRQGLEPRTRGLRDRWASIGRTRRATPDRKPGYQTHERPSSNLQSTMDTKKAPNRRETPGQSLDHGCAARDSNPEPAD